MNKEYREMMQIRYPAFHVKEYCTIFVDTGGGGYSCTYGSKEDLIKDINEDPYISSNCYKKLKKWLENRGKRHNNNLFRYENLRVEIYKEENKNDQI